ncbi:MAG TPA: DinB family protein [Planctomycetota bacterium]|nr:DinB family protein [Planctomycetota bacterium]
MGASLLRAYSASARINQYLAQRLHPAVWRVGSGRTVASLFAHMYNCGLRYLVRTDPKAAVPEELDRFTVTPAQAIRAFGAKRKAVEKVVGRALVAGRRIVGFPHDAATYLAYYLSHDSHHRGQIALLARQLGHPLDRETMSGMWQWAARAKE